MTNKPTLVFIPGTLCTSEMFQDYTSNDHFNSVVIDFIEHSSLSAMCAAVKHKVGDSPIILVGFSMGGMVAFEFIRRYPNQVQGLILLNSNSHADLPGRKEGRDEQLLQAKSKGLSWLIKNTYLPIYFTEVNQPAAKTVLAMANQLGLPVFEAQLHVLAQRPDSLPTLANFSKPSLIIGAENDIPCPVEHQQIMAKEARNSELHIIKSAGHFAALEQSTQINQIINQWVQKHYG